LRPQQLQPVRGSERHAVRARAHDHDRGRPQQPGEGLLPMSALALAKRRAARRRTEDGAAMFVVAMTIAVLASVGVYALAAASTEVKMSGNERQSTQTHYLAEFGVLAAAQFASGNTAMGDLINNTMHQGATRDTCLSLQYVPSTSDPQDLSCTRI